MNPNKVIELLKKKQFDRVIAVCEYEKTLKQSNLGEWL